MAQNDMDDPTEEILGGIADGENPADVLYLCTAMAIAIYMSSWDERTHDVSSWDERAGESYIPFREAGIYRQLLRLSGTILCPIFDYVKPADYIAKMKAVRREYAGITTDPEKRDIYHRRIKVLLDEGALRSVEKAIEAKVWARLSTSEIPGTGPIMGRSSHRSQ